MIEQRRFSILMRTERILWQQKFAAWKFRTLDGDENPVSYLVKIGVVKDLPILLGLLSSSVRSPPWGTIFRDLFRFLMRPDRR